MESWHQFDGFILDDIIKCKHFVLLALCAGNSLVTGQFPTQRPVTQSFDVFFDLSLNKRLSKQSWGSIVLIVTSLLWNLGNLVRAFVKRDSMTHGLLIWCPFHNIFEGLETLTNQQSRDPKFVWITFKFYECIPWHKISDGLDDEMFKATEQRKSMIYRSFCSYPSKTCPASIATLAQRQPLRWANVGSPTLGQRGFVNWPNVGPTVARQRWPNVVPTSAQRWHTNVGPTLAQRYANGCMPTLYQHWPNGGCVTGFLWGEPIGHRSVTGWTNSRVE